MPKKTNSHAIITHSGLPNPEHRSSAGSKTKRALTIAKITHPKIAGAFDRRRLYRLLDEYGDAPGTWIPAPAGSGKTPLVAGYLADRKLKSIWYRVDERDGDAAAFFYDMGWPRMVKGVLNKMGFYRELFPRPCAYDPPEFVPAHF